MLSISVAHLPHLDIRMPARNVAAALEREPEQLVSRVERGLDDVVKLEVRLDLALVDVALALAQLLGVVAPGPGCKLEIAALLLNERLHGVAVEERARARGRAHPLEPDPHRRWRLRRRVAELVVREALLAEHPRARSA